MSVGSTVAVMAGQKAGEKVDQTAVNLAVPMAVYLDASLVVKRAGSLAVWWAA